MTTLMQIDESDELTTFFTNLEKAVNENNLDYIFNSYILGDFTSTQNDARFSELIETIMNNNKEYTYLKQLYKSKLCIEEDGWVNSMDYLPHKITLRNFMDNIKKITHDEKIDKFYNGTSFDYNDYFMPDEISEISEWLTDMQKAVNENNFTWPIDITKLHNNTFIEEEMFTRLLETVVNKNKKYLYLKHYFELFSDDGWGNFDFGTQDKITIKDCIDCFEKTAKDYYCRDPEFYFNLYDNKDCDEIDTRIKKRKLETLSQ
jgi:hypothetical protein